MYMYQAVLVDDEKFVIEGLINSIDWAGFNFEIAYTATDPLEALEYLQSHPTHLLITDISMPQMDGIRLIREVKAINPLISILVLSAYDTFDYVRSAMRQGAENYLLKPLNPEELSDSISAIVEHLQERNELSAIYGASMLTFRSSFVENWVRGTLSEDEFLTRAELLGINLQLENYTVILFTTNGQSGYNMSLLFDHLLSLFVGAYLSHFYFETPYRLVCIVSYTGKGDGIPLLLSEIEKIRPILDFSFFVCAGDTVDNYEAVCDSYHNASKYLALQYTPLTSLNCTSFNISPVNRRLVEQDFLEVDEEEYLSRINKLIDTAPNASRCMTYQLAVTSWGVNQTLTEQTLDPALKSLLPSIVCDASDRETTKAFIRQLFEAVRAILAERRQLQSTSYPFVDAVIEAVHDFANKDISLKTIAAKLGIHPSYLGSIFHQQTGYYFNDYLNEERLKFAAEMMESSTYKLKEIVDMAGFSSQTYFNRLFKRKYGTPPNVYRREARNRQP